MPETEVWTIGRLLQWTTDYLKQHGSDSPRLDAEVLLAAARGCERIELYTAFGETPSEQVRQRFRQWVRRRAQGTPVAYLVGHREFYSLSFEVTPDVLVPRPETEFVVLTLLELAKQQHASEQAPLEILDVGTGSGIIAICAAKFIGHCRVTAVDISPQALEVARRNAEHHEVQIELIQSDLLENLPAERSFDYIVSNPPYLSQAELESASMEVREHEPPQALLGGPTGVELIGRLVEQAAERLPGDAWLIFEISPMIAPAVRELLERDGRFTDIAILPDLARLPRVARARKLAHG